MIEVPFSIQGDRDYIDIAQVSYRLLSELGIIVSNTQIQNFFIRVHRPVGKKVFLLSADDASPEIRQQTVIEFEFVQGAQLCRYIAIEAASGLPEGVSLPEPTYTEREHWSLQDNKISWHKEMETEWPVFFAFMLMGRFSGIHFFGSEKPRGICYSMKRIPRPHEIGSLWVRKLRGPIKGLGIIALGCGQEVIGTSSLKI